VYPLADSLPILIGVGNKLMTKCQIITAMTEGCCCC
jgi:hypothetical protein